VRRRGCLITVLTASVTEELLFRAYPIERLTRLTANDGQGLCCRWPPLLRSMQGWNLGHVLGVVLPLGAVMTGLYLWRRNLLFMFITHFVLDLPTVLIALSVLPPL
jgi:membrane protease YdiL (CAAX protease family)